MSAVCFLLHFTAPVALQLCSPSANNRYKVDIRQTEVASTSDPNINPIQLFYAFSSNVS